jgi:murein DD-endopeptidase MepM/ murein hydrolase activator NlpD
VSSIFSFIAAGLLLPSFVARDTVVTIRAKDALGTDIALEADRFFTTAASKWKIIDLNGGQLMSGEKIRLLLLDTTDASIGNHAYLTWETSPAEPAYGELLLETGITPEREMVLVRADGQDGKIDIGSPFLIRLYAEFVGQTYSDAFPALDGGVPDDFRNYQMPFQVFLDGETMKFAASPAVELELTFKEVQASEFIPPTLNTLSSPLLITTSLPHSELGNYMDLDLFPGSGNVRAWDGTQSTYDGHNGIDIGGPDYTARNFNHSFRLLDIGSIAVVSMQDGIVLWTDDGWDDHCISSTESVCPEPELDGSNIVWIENNDGSVAKYAHLMRNSVQVSPGDKVDCGMIFAYMGSSADPAKNEGSSAPHLHFSLSLLAGC